ncbi:MAG TPA: PEP/pyruvate-binding domain-containing protein [Verrucomicrobiae bacterium]|nr:PEP/pyruvate-binding domain-containing protein [Verrucomicrobiae bacterium]
MASDSAAAASRDTTRGEQVRTRSGVALSVDKRVEGGQIELHFQALIPAQCVLHWGVRNQGENGWRALPQSQWPESTRSAGAGALQTDFKRDNGQAHISMRLPANGSPDVIEFALFFPQDGRWDNNDHQNYQIRVRETDVPALRPMEALKAGRGPGDVLLERVFEVGDNGQLAASVIRNQGKYHVLLYSNIAAPLSLHWGIARRSPHEWLQPPDAWRPPGTVLHAGTTPQTPFEFRDGVNRLELVIPESEAPQGIPFVLKQGENRWLKQRGGNFYLPVQAPSARGQAVSAPELTDLANRIIQAEMNSNSWTLMHRFNLCFDLLDVARANTEALGLLFVWLRFSAIRQLTWQRNYNTKPRELAHAQDRLTGRLADFFHSDPHNRVLIRMMLASIGRGGDGQRIRDEILQIMHRHHIKEVSGHFLEEWHQKLHNNTTPDDVAICQAYLDFLRSNGSQQKFYDTLQSFGVTRERLQSFERPIRSDPDFVGHLKDVLIQDFENFLKILNAVHSSTDLETAANAARDRLDGDTQGLLWDVWNHRNDPAEGLAALVGKITEVRRRISNVLQSGTDLRSLLYLDLALEQLVRVAVERNLHQRLGGEQLMDLVRWVLENVTLSHEHGELGIALRQWERLCTSSPRLGETWSLQAKSVTDRLGRALSEWTDGLYKLLQPKAELLGNAFHSENWTISLFSEEVVRGSSLGFALSMLLRQADKVLRQAAHLGDWQIVSRGSGSGEVEVVDALRAVQGKTCKGPVVVVADKVMGDEELPGEVVAVIAPDVTDLVSHVAVRARNAQVLFASCSNPGTFDKIKSLKGKVIQVETTAAGDVVFKELSGAAPSDGTVKMQPKALKVTQPHFTRFAVVLDQFNERTVGAKSNSQARLRGKLPDWVRQPASIALPFGSLEKVLSAENNRQAAQKYAALGKRVKETVEPQTLKQLQEVVQSLNPPAELEKSVRDAARAARIDLPKDWEPCWQAIKAVWASKWNERAVLSRRRMGMSDDDLFMAVLIQPVVEADYAFVLHTVNPSNGNQDELYGEVVLGLGETIVGNYPGRALSFIWDKRAQAARVLAFPSKGIGLYGGGLIFRSDSNGEDLAGYAGAGLYDSVLMNPPRRAVLDYSEEPLVWDEEFRSGLLGAIGRVGEAIEKSAGSAQDIEGAICKGEYFVVQSRPQVGVGE